MREAFESPSAGWSVNTTAGPLGADIRVYEALGPVRKRLYSAGLIRSLCLLKSRSGAPSSAGRLACLLELRRSKILFQLSAKRRRVQLMTIQRCVSSFLWWVVCHQSLFFIRPTVSVPSRQQLFNTEPRLCSALEQSFCSVISCLFSILYLYNLTPVLNTEQRTHRRRWSPPALQTGPDRAARCRAAGRLLTQPGTPGRCGSGSKAWWEGTRRSPDPRSCVWSAGTPARRTWGDTYIWETGEFV